MERKQLILIGSIVGGIALAALIGLVVYLRIRATADIEPVIIGTPSGPAVQIQVGDGNISTDRQKLVDEELKRIAAMPKDTDGDGLNDERESQLGTNPESGDTDGDGYIDAVEVDKLKTDPTKPDPLGLDRPGTTRQPTITPSTPVAPVAPTPTPAPAPTDADSDGLTSEQEANVGTDPNNADSDGDGLTDRQEVETYKTDPLKADSDNDAFLDGPEVQAGYNPLGPGRCARETCIP